ncbi:MAG: hypothetical protein JNM85_01780 [Chthonomonas sp.]|nr:hypothetical protein [Chthonomonas sp.]
MKYKLISSGLLVAAGIIMAGCGSGNAGEYTAKPPEKVTPFALADGQDASLFPLVVGNQWVYEVEAAARDSRGQQNNVTTELTFTVTKVTDNGKGGKIGEIEVRDKDNELRDRQEWMVDSTGIYQISIGMDDPAKKMTKKMFTPPQLVMPFPAKVGAVGTWKGVAPVPDGKESSELTAKIEAPVDVDTSLGRFNAIQSVQVQTWTFAGDKGSMKTTSFWVPKIGFVRLWQEGSGSGAASASKFILKSKALKN